MNVVVRFHVGDVFTVRLIKVGQVVAVAQITIRKIVGKRPVAALLKIRFGGSASVDFVILIALHPAMLHRLAQRAPDAPTRPGPVQFIDQLFVRRIPTQRSRAVGSQRANRL